MNPAKRKRLESRGWRIGSSKEFLRLSEQENAYIELKLALAENLKKRRLEKKLTQVELAKLLQSNQSRVAKMEAGHPSVSLDLLVKSLLALGTTKQDIAGIILQE
ncbi:MAG: helix-turn-helix transcriptional regulator [Calditrichaceae bacterium]|nr:helix-turn-helix domain-containing protein [Calditrichia bacterium]NUQ41037.1 helix-turn-helix transcriptional regulator [Calditrichaceae bacterium]